MAPTIAVVGGGPMGLAVAYQLALEGAKPVLLEADDRLGGMAASFQFAGQTLERYYHFHCLSDQAFFALLEELGLADQLRWKQTSMGFFVNGRLYRWGSAGSVLSFRRLPLLTRLRYLLHAARCLSLRHWQHLDGIRATDWLKRWLGPQGYALLWQKLFAYKFYEHSETLSAAWIWSRIRRLGQSRRWLKETLGYLEGGSQRWIDALEQRLRDLGCEIQLSSPVQAIRSLGPGQGAVVRTLAGERHFDAVISTVPLPLVAPMLQAGGGLRLRGAADPPADHRQLLDQHQRRVLCDPGHHRVLESAAAAGAHHLRALLHARQPPGIPTPG
jgi:protoporphyrinogen oxidase